METHRSDIDKIATVTLNSWIQAGAWRTADHLPVVIGLAACVLRPLGIRSLEPYGACLCQEHWHKIVCAVEYLVTGTILVLCAPASGERWQPEEWSEPIGVRLVGECSEIARSVLTRTDAVHSKLSDGIASATQVA